MREAKRKNDILVVSIFVNPMQFGPNEDFNQYPRDIARDSSLALEVGTDCLFCPSAEDMYPEGFDTSVSVNFLSSTLCGPSRPGHFAGVATIVLKLFNLVRPHQAFFGLKDYQQFIIIRRMVADLNLDMEVVGLPTVREQSGLALSSRNIYLSLEHRTTAAALSKTLFAAQRFITERKLPTPLAALEFIHHTLAAEAPEMEIEYLEIRDAESLREITSFASRSVIAAAVRLGNVRLIDNVLVEPSNSP